MSGIAQVLLSLGYKVSGSDIKKTSKIIDLMNQGVPVSIGHKKENIQGASYVVYTSAVTETNIELMAARENRIPVMQRTQMLAELMRAKQGISVAGTHGKTTTTGILTTILKECNLDPTYIVGGKVLNLGEHARCGLGQHLIVEADESDGTFLLLNPIYVIVTNIDYDHMDFYGSKKKLYQAFEDFFNKVPFYGLIAVHAHDKNTMAVTRNIKKRWVTFGILEEGERPTVYADNLVYSDKGSAFDVFANQTKLGGISINIPGRHNVLNALGAVTMAHFMGIDFESIRRGIRSFKGIERRFEKMMDGDGPEIFDDYAHHPTEIAATLNTFKKIRPHKKRVVIFEPHRFTRTKHHWNEFCSCFKDADEVYLLDIYSASEPPLAGIDSKALALAIGKPVLKQTIVGRGSLKRF